LFAKSLLKNLQKHSRASSLLQIMVLAGLPGIAHADYQTGVNAYVDGDFATAMAEWKAEVNQPGEPENLAIYRESLYAISMLYWQGEGVKQDYTVSAVWLKQAADINHPGAQNKLGYLYSTGQGVPQNFQEARRYFELAAAQGDPDAAHNLDRMFEQGLLGATVAPDPDGTLPPTVTSVQGPPVQEAPVQEAPVQEAPVQDKPPETPETTKPARPAGDSGEAWIRARNPEHYTIQVIALREPDLLREFIAAHPDWQPFAIYQPAGNERPLHVLVQGDYADVEAARAAVAKFPAGLQKAERMWIRKFGKVQERIE
jgi:hypothetical protein